MGNCFLLKWWNFQPILYNSNRNVDIDSEVRWLVIHENVVLPMKLSLLLELLKPVGCFQTKVFIFRQTCQYEICYEFFFSSLFLNSCVAFSHIYLFRWSGLLSNRKKTNFSQISNSKLDLNTSFGHRDIW